MPIKPSTPSTCAKGSLSPDGTPLDAAAVAKNFDTYGLGDKAHRLPVSEVINNLPAQRSDRPADGKILLQQAVAGLPAGTATIGSGLVSLSTLQRNFEELGDARHIIGSGPFVVQDEKPGRELTLVARKDYQWGPKNIAQQGPANLDGITYIVTPEDGDAYRRAAGRSGGLYSPGAGSTMKSRLPIRI